jgi:hypothetical protein
MHMNGKNRKMPNSETTKAKRFSHLPKRAARDMLRPNTFTPKKLGRLKVIPAHPSPDELGEAFPNMDSARKALDFGLGKVIGPLFCRGDAYFNVD